jgi:hypothetical protein
MKITGYLVRSRTSYLPITKVGIHLSVCLSISSRKNCNENLVYNFTLKGSIIYVLKYMESAP